MLREVPPRFRWIYTILLPIAYNIVTAFGISAAAVIIPSVASFTSREYAHLWAVFIGILGLAAFIALASRRERLEFYVACALAVALCYYPGVLLVSGVFAGHADRIPSGIGLLLIPMIPASRAIDIIRTVRKRIATAEMFQDRRPAA